MDTDLIYVVLVINLIMSILFYLQKRCELPLFIALFNMMVQYRVLSLELGLSQFVHFDYQIDFVFSFELAYKIAELIMIGSTVMIYAIMFFFKSPIKKIKDDNDLLKQFILQRKTYIFIGLGFFTLIHIAIRDVQNSYGFLTKLANNSFILLFFLIYFFTKISNLQVKILYLGTLILVGAATYSSELRFQFLGWMIPLGYFLTRNIKPLPKLWFMLGGLFSILIIFSAAGALRYINLDGSSVKMEELYEQSYERMEESDDINFIDGFMMMYQVYPKYLDYTYGFEHLAVFLRPIPRTIWSDKPLAGWFQNYQKKYGLEKSTIGFSPTIYGVFYAEMGTEGIVVFSIIWAYGLVWLYRYVNQFSSDLSWLLTGIMLTALIPIFRSGDLPGDVAIVLMSYWPVIIFVYYYRKFLKKRMDKDRLYGKTL